MSPDKEPLSAEFLQQAVIDATPDPKAFHDGADPSAVTLFDLGVVGGLESAIFVRALRTNIRPWDINDSDVASSPGSTVQQAADSVAQNAF